MREKVTQIQETQRVPNKRNPKRPTTRHIIIKMAKVQDTEDPKGSKGEKGSNIQGSPNIDKQLTSQWKCSKPDENGKKYSK